MSPVIRISDEIYKELEKLAIGFDTPVNVIERLLEQTENANKKPVQKNNSKYIKKRSKMTEETVEAIYSYAKDVYEKKMQKEDAAEKLVSDFEMNRNSSLIYLWNFIYMMEGKIYKKTMSAMITEYYLRHILEDYGKNILTNALSSLCQHIDYLSEYQNGKSKTLLKIYNKFSPYI